MVKFALHAKYLYEASKLARRQKIPMIAKPKMLFKHSRIAIKLIKLEVLSFLMM